MNFDRKPIRPAGDPARPASVLCRSLAELRATLARGDRLEKAGGRWVEAARGEYFVRAMEAERLGVWRLHLEWHQKSIDHGPGLAFNSGQPG